MNEYFDPVQCITEQNFSEAFNMNGIFFLVANIEASFNTTEDYSPEYFDVLLCFFGA